MDRPPAAAAGAAAASSQKGGAAADDDNMLLCVDESLADWDDDEQDDADDSQRLTPQTPALRDYMLAQRVQQPSPYAHVMHGQRPRQMFSPEARGSSSRPGILRKAKGRSPSPLVSRIPGELPTLKAPPTPQPVPDQDEGSIGFDSLIRATEIAEGSEATPRDGIDDAKSPARRSQRKRKIAIPTANVEPAAVATPQAQGRNGSLASPLAGQRSSARRKRLTETTPHAANGISHGISLLLASSKEISPSNPGGHNPYAPQPMYPIKREPNGSMAPSPESIEETRRCIEAIRALSHDFSEMSSQAAALPPANDPNVAALYSQWQRASTALVDNVDRLVVLLQ